MWRDPEQETLTGGGLGVDRNQSGDLCFPDYSICGEKKKSHKLWRLEELKLTGVKTRKCKNRFEKKKKQHINYIIYNSVLHSSSSQDPLMWFASNLICWLFFNYPFFPPLCFNVECCTNTHVKWIPFSTVPPPVRWVGWVLRPEAASGESSLVCGARGGPLEAGMRWKFSCRLPFTRRGASASIWTCGCWCSCSSASASAPGTKVRKSRRIGWGAGGVGAGAGSAPPPGRIRQSNRLY